MNYSQFMGHMSEIRSNGQDIRVTIPIRKLHATIGGQPCVDVAFVAAGFDWDNGNIFITPAEPLMLVSDCETAPEKVRGLQEKLGWVDYENRGLKTENARLRKRIKELEDAKQ